MKSSFVFAGILSLGLSSGVFAAPNTPPPSFGEVVELGGDIGVSRCFMNRTPDGDTSSCDSEASSGMPILIALKQCQSSSSEPGSHVPSVVSCKGSWNTQTIRDGHEFVGEITVTKTSFDNGDTFTYLLEAKVGATLHHEDVTSVRVYMKNNGTVTDTFSFAGKPLVSSTSTDGSTYTQYTPTLWVGPKLPTP